MKERDKSKRNGATLVEVLVYLALFAMVFTVFIRLFWFVSESNRRAAYRTELDRNAIFISEHLEYMVDNSEQIDDSLSIFNADEGKLVLMRAGVTREYILANGVLYYQEDGSAVQLSSERYVVDRFNLTKIGSIGESPLGVRVHLVLTAADMPDMEFTLNTAYTLE